MHTLISLVAIVAGLIVVIGLLSSKTPRIATMLFTWSLALTCITGFFFRFEGFKPSYVVGVLTLVMLSLAATARRRSYSGRWRATYVIATSIACWFNFFVLGVQLFMHVPALNALAPTGGEPIFAVVQGVVFVSFVVLAVLGVRHFRP